jgi:hypothetical protein
VTHKKFENVWFKLNNIAVIVHYCTSFISRYIVTHAGLLRLQVGLKVL